LIVPVAGEVGEPLTVWRTALNQQRPYLDLGDAVEAALDGMGPDERAAVALFLRRFLERSDRAR
jgi:hypothetical protein